MYICIRGKELILSYEIQESMYYNFTFLKNCKT